MIKPEEKPDECKVCPLYESEEGIVWGVGPVDAKEMYIAEGPGEEEGLTGIPFSGGAGRTLNALFRHAGIDRESVFITNVVKCRPTVKKQNGKIDNRPPTDAEIRACAPKLIREIRQVNPNIIITLGNISTKALTGVTKGIMQMRSVPIPGMKRDDGDPERYKILPTFHPAHIMRNQELWPLEVFDLVRARRESTNPHITRRPWRRVIHARLSDVGEHLERSIRSGGTYGGMFLRPYHHDLETTGLNPSTSAFRCIGIAARSDEVYVFDWTTDVIEFVRRLHADPELLTVGQNSEGFDIWFQEAKGFEFNGPSYDTLIGFHNLNSSLPKDLGSIGATVTDEPYWKDETMYKAGEDALQHGCAKDIHATARAFEDQMEEAKQKNQLDIYFKHIMPLQPVLRRMSRRGLRKDKENALRWKVKLNRAADVLDAKLKKGLGDSTFNVDSPTQLMDLLYRRMGLPVQYKKDPKTGDFRPSVDAGALDELAKKTNNPILTLVRAIRTYKKWDATFVDAPHDDNWFVHGRFSVAKAANFRMNSYEPNMQNFPVDIREIFVPDSKEHVLISRDWSQIEWRIAMALSGCRVGLDALAAGRDVHQDAWSEVWGVPYDQVTKRDRFEAKRYNYGLLYGRGVDSLASGGAAGTAGVAIPRDMVQGYFDGFWTKFWEYDRLRKEIERQVRDNHYVEQAWGRRRYWYTRSQMPEAYNFPIQGTAASMMYEILVELEEQLPKGATLRLTVHDEVVINSTKDHKTLSQALECSRDVMERVFPQILHASLYPDTVREYFPQGWFCPSDCHIGENWKICKGDSKADLAVESELRDQLGVANLFDAH